jgi:phage terminase large subunit
MSNLLNLATFGLRLGCPPDQLLNFQRACVTLQPRQLMASAAARLCDLPEGPTAIGYGGARGGGKSHWLMAQMGADDCQRLPDLKCLLLRKVGKSNRENFEDLRQKVFRNLPHDYTASRGMLTFENGSRIIIGHFQNEKDIDAYLGLEYDVIGVEEATTLTARKYSDIQTCNRTSRLLPTGEHWRPRSYSTTNPGGVGHAWYRKLFILPYQSKTQTETRFIPARVTDNQFTNPGYCRNLDRLTGWRKRAWYYGDWDISAGQFFTTFRRDVHVLSQFDEGRGVEWFAALDYGFTHYTVALLACKDSDGNIFVVDEHAERNWLPERHAAAIHAMLARHHIAISGSAFTRRCSRPLVRFVGGADLFSRQHDGTTIASQYARLGISMRPAAMDRINGWAEVLRLLGDPDHPGTSPVRLYIHERCGRLIDCLPNLQHDPYRPEDVLKIDSDEDGLGGDDSADALRYLVATKPSVIHEVRLGF